jgi:hypothetical protein
MPLNCTSIVKGLTISVEFRACSFFCFGLYFAQWCRKKYIRMITTAIKAMTRMGTSPKVASILIPPPSTLIINPFAKKENKIN